MSFKGTTTASSLNIRSGPGTAYSSVGSYPQGTVLEIDKVSGNWGNIAGTNNWISMDYIERVADETLPIAIQKFLEIASNEVGYLEKASNSNLYDKTANAGYNNYTKYAYDLNQIGYLYNGNKNGYSWCDVFYDWNMVQLAGPDLAWKMLGQPNKGLGASCKYSVQYYKAMNRFYKSNPQPGDQIFFTDKDGAWAHTGIVERVDNSKVYTIEGNTSSKSGVVANGGSVERKSYNLTYSRIGGYGRPLWDLYQPEEPEVIDNNDDITQEEFNALMDAYLIGVALEQPNNYSKDARIWAESNGYIRGDENGNAMYKKFMTREEMITVLSRILGGK